MPDYSKSIIYTIRSRDNVYVGSTIDFRSRKKDHKKCIYNQNQKAYNYKLYKTIRGNNYEWDMQPYSQYPCNSKMELTIKEERVRQLLKADMNTISCGTGLTEKEYKKQYRDEHKDKISERRKQYNDQHRDEINDKSKQYYDQYKNKISEKNKQKVTCACGCVIVKRCLSKHRKTKKHINLMEKLNQ